MDIMQAALKKFEAKMSMPQYEQYRDNEDARDALMWDCLREAAAEERLGGYEPRRTL